MLEELPEPAPACRFTHELVRRAVYDRITALRRAELHLRVGEALERVHAADPTASCPSSPTTSRSPPRSPASSAASTTTCARPRRRSRRPPTTRRRRGSRPRSSSGSPTRASARASRSSSPTSSARPGGVAEADAILVGEPRRRDRPGGARPRGACAPSTRVGSGWAIRRSTRTRCGRSPRRRSRRSGSSATRAASPRPSAGSAIALRARGPLERGVRRARTGARRTPRPRATRRRATDGDRIARRCALRRPDAGRRGDPPLRGAPAQRAGTTACSTRSSRAASPACSRWPAASTRRASTSERSSLVLDELDHSTPLWVYRMLAAEAKELLGDRAGRGAELLARWQRIGELGLHARRERDARRLPPRPPLLRRGPLGRRRALSRLRPRRPRAALLPHRRRARPRRPGAAGRATAADSPRRWRSHGAASSSPIRATTLDHRARVWLALAEVQRADGDGPEADAAVAEAIRLYEAKGNVAAAAAVRAGGPAASARGVMPRGRSDTDRSSTRSRPSLGRETATDQTSPRRSLVDPGLVVEELSDLGHRLVERLPEQFCPAAGKVTAWNRIPALMHRSFPESVTASSQLEDEDMTCERPSFGGRFSLVLFRSAAASLSSCAPPLDD